MRVKYLIYLCLLAFNIYWGAMIAQALTPRGFAVYVLDVGQGDAILVRSPEGKYGLIDTGRGNAVVKRLAEVMPWGQREIEFVLLTHPDADHAEGILSLLQTYEVKHLFWHKRPADPGVYMELRKLLPSVQVPNYQLQAGHRFALGCCTQFRVLWPAKDTDIWRETDTNHLSTTVILQYGRFRMWLGGDLDAQTEEEIVRQWGVEQTDVQILKAGHHGSKTSTSSGFLAAITPEVTVISAGRDNQYGHPHSEVLANLAAVGSIVWRTDQSGTIEIGTDGANFFQLNTASGLEYLYPKL